ncbi:amidase [Algihabitans albus]|uniref:amidase n=1 Tax=Algihabitans albus TaxID=2164067 RepID=UPI000E5D14C3|nr:amidase family protein [Algihabitans albus]
MTLTAAGQALRDRRISAEELTANCLDAVAAEQGRLNAFISVETEAALATARACDAELQAGRPLGPLHGLPLAHKDMFYRAGRRCTCGSLIRRHFVPGTSSSLVARLEAAGAVTLGGLHMAEFAMGPTGHNAHYGSCRNPWNPDYISGGSSSGSGAAVAARLVFGALGSDTGGSVRLPAAICGTVGLKPTQGLLDRHGMMPLSDSLDCPGVLARSSEDLALLMDVLLDTSRHVEALSRRSLEGLTIGLPAQFYFDDLVPEVGQALEAARRELERLGARVRSVDLPDHGTLGDLANLVFTPEAAALHLTWLTERPEDYGDQVRARLLQGLTVSAVHHLQAKQLRSLFTRALLEGAFASCDLMLAPVLRTLVPTAVETDVAADARMTEVVAGISVLTRPLSYLGFPGLVTPVGFDSKGLPIAMQLIGRPRDEATLLRVADVYERANDWLSAIPPAAVATRQDGGSQRVAQ